jgi:hypothetical protein
MVKWKKKVGRVDMWYTLGIIVVICSLFSVFFRDFEDGWHFIKKVVLFVPIIILGIIIYILENFSKNRVGFIILFLVFAFIMYGVVMGIRAGPSSPAPWE